MQKTGDNMLRTAASDPIGQTASAFPVENSVDLQVCSSRNQWFLFYFNFQKFPHLSLGGSFVIKSVLIALNMIQHVCYWPCHPSVHVMLNLLESLLIDPLISTLHRQELPTKSSLIF